VIVVPFKVSLVAPLKFSGDSPDNSQVLRFPILLFRFSTDHRVSRASGGGSRSPGLFHWQYASASWHLSTWSR